MTVRDILLLRHGKSDWSQPSPDIARPLKSRGKRGAQQMGVWIAQQQLIPQQVLTSPAVRARLTAEKCVKSMGQTVELITEMPSLYEAAPTTLLKSLQQLNPAIKRLMLVGHNPELEALLEMLASREIEIPEDGKLLPTATLAHLTFEGPWQELTPASAQLKAIVRSRNLPKTFPFPNPDSPEQRNRPAYYYTQSSVIPYRTTTEGIEILMITSSSGKRWVVPKGIQEPGKSAQESAAIEAHEEAGVTGSVTAEPLGHYRYPKWGSECAVSVYPMLVDRELPEQVRLERYRQRRWLSPEAAAERVSQTELKPLILKLAKEMTRRERR
jgi:phosphohistidine phosphatase